MKTFKDLEFIEHPNHIGGIRASIMFENGYGVSVVSNTYSYGGKDGLFEVAVLGKDGDITYDTPVTNDVIGYLNKETNSNHISFDPYNSNPIIPKYT